MTWLEAKIHGRPVRVSAGSEREQLHGLMLVAGHKHGSPPTVAILGEDNI